MINSVNLSKINPFSVNGNSSYSAQSKGQTSLYATGHSQPSFGYGEYYSDHPMKDALLGLTGGVWNLIGFNVALGWLQNFVNGKVLVGKINKHYTDKIKNSKNDIEKLADEMQQEEHLTNVNRYTVNGNDAFYTEAGDYNRKIKPNSVVVGENEFSSLFHELGHAKIENKTGFLKELQRFRGNYTWLALGLYALMSQNKSQNQDVFGDGRKSFGEKVKNFLGRASLLVPLLAFSPELITEAKASQYGLKFLAKKVKEGKLEESVFKNIKKSYLTCFGTYLFIPVSIILMELLTSGIEKEVNKSRQQNVYYY